MRQVPARLLSCLSASTADFHVEATPEAASGLRRAVLQLQEVAAGNLLLNVEFETIFDYLMVRIPSAFSRTSTLLRRADTLWICWEARHEGLRLPQ